MGLLTSTCNVFNNVPPQYVYCSWFYLQIMLHVSCSKVPIVLFVNTLLGMCVMNFNIILCILHDEQIEK